MEGKDDIYEVYSKLSKTKTMELNTISRENLVVDFKGIRKYHQFLFVDEGVIDCREMSNIGPKIRQIVNFSSQLDM
jgi:hypothetical protein